MLTILLFSQADETFQGLACGDASPVPDDFGEAFALFVAQQLRTIWTAAFCAVLRLSSRIHAIRAIRGAGETGTVQAE